MGAWHVLGAARVTTVEVRLRGRQAGGLKHLITIGQLADYAGVTIKAVRHYHRRGLLDEPPRDSSGYRRYSARHAIALVKIKTLADAGVPLARMRELLDADPHAFAAAVDDIDRTLRARIRRLSQARQRIGELSAGDCLFVSPDVADFLGQLRDLGVSRRIVRMERDIWILMQSVSPAQAAVWLAEKRQAVRDPEFCAIYREYDAAFDWPADDPRLEVLAQRTRRWMASNSSQAGKPSANDPAVARLVAAAADVSSPAWDSLNQLGAGEPSTG